MTSVSTESKTFFLKVQSERERLCVTVRRGERIPKRTRNEPIAMLNDSQLHAVPKTTINAEHVLSQSSVGLNQFLSGGRSKDWIVELHISIAMNAMNRGTFWSPPKGCISLNAICSEISSWKNLRHLSLCTTISPASSAQQQQSVLQPLLPLGALAGLIFLPRLTTLKLTGFWFVGENVHMHENQILSRACAAARSLRTVDIRNIFFYTTDRLVPGARAQFCAFMSSLPKLRALRRLVITGCNIPEVWEGRTRPDSSRLILGGLRNIFSIESLESLWLENITIDLPQRGHEGASACAHAIRNNTKLRFVKLSHIDFKGHGGFLAGLDQNTHIKQMDLTGSTVHLEAQAMAYALQQNRTLRKLLINDALFGCKQTHMRNLRRVISGIENHPTLHTLHLPPNLDQASYQTVLRILENNRIITDINLGPEVNEDTVVRLLDTTDV
jgi:hypothetical protein